MADLTPIDPYLVGPGETLKTDKTPFQEIGSTGLLAFTGQIFEEKTPALAGTKGRQTYREMRDSDPVINGILFAIEMLMRKVEWETRPYDDSSEAVDIADFVESCRTDMSQDWQDTIADITTFLQYGWSFLELVYKQRSGPDQTDGQYRSAYSDGRIGWRKFAIRAQDTLLRWVFDETGGVQGMTQLAPPHYQIVTIPIERGLLFRTTGAKGSPEGRSILRSAYIPWYLKRHIQNIEGVGIERDLAGLPVMEAPAALFDPDASPAQKATLEAIRTIVRNVRRDEQEGLIIPQEWDDKGRPTYTLKLLSTGGSRQFDIDKVVARYDQRMAMNVLADWLLLGHEAVGSKALAVDKTQMFAQAIQAWLNHVAAVINRHAVPRLLRLNGLNAALAPRITPGGIEDTNITELVTAITGLVSAGMPLFPDEDLEAWVRERLGLPPVTDAVKQQRALAEQQSQQMQELALQAQLAKAQQPQPTAPPPGGQQQEQPAAGDQASSEDEAAA